MQPMLSERQQMALLLRADRATTAVVKKPSTPISIPSASPPPQKPILSKAQLSKPAPVWIPNDYPTWISQKQAAWANIKDDPAPFYFYYAPPSFTEQSPTAPWTAHENSQLNTLVESRTHPGEQLTASVWGYLSMYMPGRPGCQLQKQYAQLHPELRITQSVPTSISKFSPTSKIAPPRAGKSEKPESPTKSASASVSNQSMHDTPSRLPPTPNHAAKELASVTPGALSQQAKNLSKMITKSDKSANKSVSNAAGAPRLQNALGTKNRPQVSQLFSQRNASAVTASKPSPINGDRDNDDDDDDDDDGSSDSNSDVQNATVKSTTTTPPPPPLSKLTTTMELLSDDESAQDLPSAKKTPVKAINGSKSATLSRSAHMDQNNVINMMDKQDLFNKTIKGVKKANLKATISILNKTSRSSSSSSSTMKDLGLEQPQSSVKRSRYSAELETPVQNESATTTPLQAPQHFSMLANFTPTPISELLNPTMNDGQRGDEDCMHMVKKQRTVSAHLSTLTPISPVFSSPSDNDSSQFTETLSLSTTPATSRTAIIPPSHFSHHITTPCKALPREQNKVESNATHVETPTPTKRLHTSSSQAHSIVDLYIKGSTERKYQPKLKSTTSNAHLPPFYSFYTPYNPLTQTTTQPPMSSLRASTTFPNSDHTAIQGATVSTALDAFGKVSNVPKYAL